MKLIGNEPPTLFAPAKAEEVAAALHEGDEDWDYRVVHDPKGTGYSYIDIYDEDGEFVSAFTGR